MRELLADLERWRAHGERVALAREVLRGGAPRLLTYGISDDLALSVGLPCGGEIDVWVDEPDPALLERLAEIVRDERRAVVLTDLEDGSQRLAVDGEDAQADELIRGGHSRVVEVE